MMHIRLTMLAATLASLVALAVGARDIHAQDSPEDIVQEFFDEIDAGDATGALALLSDDFVLTDINGGSFALYGKPAAEAVFADIIAGTGTAEVTDISANGGAVSATVEFSDEDSESAGVDRYVQFIEATVTDDGLISRIDATYDEDDAQTAEYLDAQPDDDDAPPPGATQVTLAAQPGGNQPGTAWVAEFEPGVVGVAIDVAPGAAGVQQPAHFHTGTCAAPGPIVEPLANVLGGQSFTILSADYDELTTQGLVINVHLSVPQAATYVSCGVVGGASVGPTPTVPAGPVPTATRPTGVTAPDTGAGSGGDGGSTVWLFIALGTGALACAAGAGTLASRR